MAASKKKANREESGSIDHDSGVDCRGTRPVTPRERTLFMMSMIRTICALLGALAQAIVLYKVYHLGGH